jgi:DNA polymerase III subunit epsilon
MCRRVRHIDARRTAGELGSSLLESRLIKQLRPMYNIMAREKRTLVLARRTLTREGYSSVLLEAIDHLAPSAISSFMGLFKSKIRAREVLATISKTFRLCPKLLGIESTRRHCFSYHLGVCNGACMGEEDRLLYNTRFEQAFADRRFKAWPYEGGLIIEEHAVDDMRREMFLVDHWCLLSSVTCREDAGIPGTQRFDYDIYKILSRYIFDDANRANIVHISRREVEMLIREPILPGALVPVQEAHRTS